MGFSELKKDLLDKAEKESNRIISEAETQAKKMLAEVEAEEQAAQEQNNRSISQLKDALEKREIASGSLEAKKKLLLAKKELIEKVFTIAVDEMDSRLPAKDRKALIERLVKKASEEIEIARICCNKNDCKNVKKFKAEEKEMLGGIVASNKEGSVTVDYSFESMLHEIRDSDLAHIANILFK